MKHGKKLTRQEKVLLSKSKLDPVDYLTIKRLSEEIHFINKVTGKVLIMPI